jgi:hypothetical protein
MKRGYMAWNKQLLSPESIQKRRDILAGEIKRQGLSCAVIFGDVSTADEIQYLTNFFPYWFSSTAIIYPDGTYCIVTAFSARINAWLSELTGLPEEKIFAAGPKILEKTAAIVAEQGGAKPAGYAGKYAPAEMVSQLEKGGSKTVCLQPFLDEMLAKPDAAFTAIVKEGVAILSESFSAVLGQPYADKRHKQIAADLERACRSRRCMDFLVTEAGKDLVFDAPGSSEDFSDPWTLSVQMQYLGQWAVATRCMNPKFSDRALKQVIKEEVKNLVPGLKISAYEKDGIKISFNDRITSDFLLMEEGFDFELYDGQIVLITATDKKNGILVQDLYEVKTEGNILLTDF